MKITSSKNTEPNKYELIIEVGVDEFTPAVERAYRKNAPRLNIPGFRKGKAPKAMVVKMFGEGMFFEDAVNELYPTAYEEAIKESGLSPVAFPKIDITKVDKDGFTFTALVVNKPEVEVGEYKGIKAEKVVKTVQAGEIDAELLRLRQRGARIITAEGRAAKDGDIAVIDFEGFIGDTAFDGGRGENHNLKLGSGQFIPGFEEQIVGHSAGDAFDVNVKFPEDYHDELKGKDATFKVKLHEIKEEQLPELDDEFAKDVSEFDTLKEYKESIAERLQKTKDAEAEADLENTLIEKIIQELKGDIPQEMIDTKVDDLLRDYEYRLRGQGIPMDRYLEYMGQTKESFRETFKEPAEKQVKIRLALEKIAKIENITPSDEDVQEEYKRVAERFGGDIEKIKASIPFDDIREDTAVGKAIDIVKDSAVITEVEEKAAKPAKKTAKPAKKPAAKTEAGEKPTKKAAAKEPGDEKPEKKPAAKKTAKKADEE